jgi:sulfur-carrier protein
VAGVRVLLFARARETAGCSADTFDAPTLGALLDAARDRYGPSFVEVLAASRVWVNGDEPPLGDDTVLADADEVAVLPPVSGGATGLR